MGEEENNVAVCVIIVWLKRELKMKRRDVVNAWRRATSNIL